MVNAKYKGQIKKLAKLGLFTLQDVRVSKIPITTFQRMVKAGVFKKIGRGHYQHPKATIDYSKLDWVMACRKMGHKAVISGVTTLFHYGLTNQVPRKIWLVVPGNKQSSDPMYIVIRSGRATTDFTVSQAGYRIATIERAIIECLRYAKKVGTSLAISAAVKAINENKTTLNKLVSTAEKLGYKKVMEKYWDAITGGTAFD